MANELLKHPDDFVLIGKSGDDFGRADQQIVNLFRRDVNIIPTTVINIENFKENGMMKCYRIGSDKTRNTK